MGIQELSYAAMKKRYPKIDDPTAAISFALALSLEEGTNIGFDFLQAWNEGSWDQIEEAYPKFLEPAR